MNRCNLKELCSYEHSNGCLKWFGVADDSTYSISCKTRYTDKMERSITQIKGKFKELRQALRSMNCIEMKIKSWLIEESILSDSMKYDMQHLITLYSEKYGLNVSLL